MDMEIQRLVEGWNDFRQMLEPSRDLLLKVVAEPGLPHQDILQLGFLASRLGYWQVFCCLMGYSLSQDKHPEDVLESIPFQTMWRDERIWDRESWAEVHPFLSYCGGFEFVEPATFLPSAYAIANTIPIRWESFEMMYSGARLLAECMALNPRPPRTIADVYRCVAEAKIKSAQQVAVPSGAW